MPIRIRPRRAACQIVSFCFVVVLTSWLLSGNCFAQEQTLIATVTDVKGEESTITDLRARYESPDEEKLALVPGAVGAGKVYRVPGSTEHLPTLIITLALKEGRTAWEETTSIALSDLQKISFESRPVAPFPPERIFLERRDGSRIMIERSDNNLRAYDAFEERDSRGEVKKAIKPGLGKITVTCSFEDRRFLLKGFEGRAKTSTGAVGEFYIEFSEVRSIVIK